MSSHDRPRSFQLGGKRLVDVRHLFPVAEPAGRLRDLVQLVGVGVHHDGVIMAPGDRNYSGSTLDEDLQRLRIIYGVALDWGWGGFPYHLVASPNGRVFYTLSIDYYGAHVARRNYELLGLALMGNFMDRPPGTPQLCAAGLALAAIQAELQGPDFFNGHGQYAMRAYPTSCPGDTWFAWDDTLGRFRDLHAAAA